MIQFGRVLGGWGGWVGWVGDIPTTYIQLTGAGSIYKIVGFIPEVLTLLLTPILTYWVMGAGVPYKRKKKKNMLACDQPPLCTHSIRRNVMAHFILNCHLTVHGLLLKIWLF